VKCLRITLASCELRKSPQPKILLFCHSCVDQLTQHLLLYCIQILECLSCYKIYVHFSSAEHSNTLPKKGDHQPLLETTARTLIGASCALDQHRILRTYIRERECMNDADRRRNGGMEVWSDKLYASDGRLMHNPLKLSCGHGKRSLKRLLFQIPMI
jgi:hypothetical protein